MESMVKGMNKFALDFYKGKTVLITGHTGFKGSWLARILIDAGAKITGYALEPPTQPNLFELCNLSKEMDSVIGDIRDLEYLKSVFLRVQPEIVIHLAAQPIVRESYSNPIDTYQSNVMGTANLLECVRKTECVKSFLNVTTDKVYENKEWYWGYREDDRLGGYDPYSNSKACSELVTASYYQSFLKEKRIAVSTARAGNVIGGGDFAKDRIIPDCIKAVKEKPPIILRNPYSVRPYQHVLEPITAYLLIAREQYNNMNLSGNYNIGPEEYDCIATGQLTDLFCRFWENGAQWVNSNEIGPHEAGFLKLDCSKMKQVFGWTPVWHIEEAINKTVSWYQGYLSGEDVSQIMRCQIEEYLFAAKKNDNKIQL